MSLLPTSFISPKMQLLACLFFFFLLPYANPISFNISFFDPEETNVLYRGDATPSAGAIVLNGINYLHRVSHVTYAEPFHLWDSITGSLSDFTTHFSFTIESQIASSYGYGLAFFLAPISFQIPPDSSGGYLGLFNTTNSSTMSANKIIAIEFDAFSNPEWDPPAQHVGINVNSIASAMHSSWDASLHHEEKAHAWITYNASTKNLTVFWTYQKDPIFQGNSTLSCFIDLAKFLPESVTIGFSAATGLYEERNTIHSWEFSSSLIIRETKGTKKGKIKLIESLIVFVGVLIGGVGTFRLILGRMGWRKEATKEIGIDGDLERSGPRRFSHGELVLATQNFSDERKLGQGGFGAVYKGVLSGLDLSLAVKKISKGSKQGEKEYRTEVNVLSKLRHRNLVQLIGWCHDQGEFLLVYEFFPKGSLDYYLFGKKSCISWPDRYKIALGLASAMHYLQEECEQCVLHRDIKSANVMLDSSFNAKLGDFGLARLMDHELSHQTTGLAGTCGYLAPECISTGKASKESDVFSFGVVALEIACGRKSFEPTRDETLVGLVEQVWELYGNGRLLSGADERLCMDFDVKQMECLMIVGLWCTHPDHILRPSMRHVIQVLSFEAVLPNLPNKMPVPMYRVEDPPLHSKGPSITFTSLEMGR
ncbi:hypothetical protein HHK36_012793 [Tetracentron sinense]|uniref:Protein kinase domain-containing protein n=1 Tax=Tetracentron sinense TaxID=13715 RepID=A0A834Z9R0_TETSI|nr:hypothetical protein HHK36_012793 [Tetracentron sinense]